MVTTRSQGPAETTDALPLRSRNLTNPLNTPPKRVRPMPGGGTPSSSLSEGAKQSHARHTLDDKTRSTVQYGTSDATYANGVSPEGEQRRHIALGPTDQQTTAEEPSLNAFGETAQGKDTAEIAFYRDEDHLSTGSPSTQHEPRPTPPNGDEISPDTANNINDMSQIDDNHTAHVNTSQLVRADDKKQQQQEGGLDWAAPDVRMSSVSGHRRRLSRPHPSHARQAGRPPLAMDHHRSIPRVKSSLGGYRAQKLAHRRRTSKWPGQKSSFIVGR